MKEAAHENGTRPRSRRRWWIVAAVGFLTVCAFWFFLSGPDAGTATVLNDRSAFENRVAAAMNRLPSGLRSFLRKIKVKLVGPARLVLVDVFVVHFSEPPAISEAKPLEVRGPGQNVRMFVIQATNADAFRDVLKGIKGSRVLSAPQVSAFSGQLAQVSTYANPMPGIYQGCTVDVLPRVRQGATDIAIHAEALSPLASDSGKPTGTLTNILASVRVDLQPYTGVLVLPEVSSGSSTGIFVLPSMFRLKQ